MVYNPSEDPEFMQHFEEFRQDILKAQAQLEEIERKRLVRLKEAYDNAYASGYDKGYQDATDITIND